MMILLSSHTRSRMLFCLARICVFLISLNFGGSSFGQLNIETTPRTKPKPRANNSRSMNDIAGKMTAKVEHDGRQFYGSPLAWDGKQLALLRWDGRITKLPATKETKVEVIDQNFLPYTPAELKQRLQKEFGDRYEVSLTDHHVVVHPNGKSAVWADPFEKLYGDFHHWFEDNGLQPAAPQFPLIAIVLRSRRDFDRFMKKDLDLTSRAIQGFYNHESNRMMMFDPSQKLRVEDKTWLYRDRTIVHEATHQTAFNTGVHSRFAPPPRWLAEGLAMLFETRGFNRSREFPKPKDRINRKRLAELRKLNLGAGLPDALTNLIGGDRIFNVSPQDAYPLSWALSYFLAEKRTRQYILYLKLDASRQPYTVQPPVEQLRIFSEVFGNDMEQLKAEIEEFYAKLN